MSRLVSIGLWGSVFLTHIAGGPATGPSEELEMRFTDATIDVELRLEQPGTDRARQVVDEDQRNDGTAPQPNDGVPGGNSDRSPRSGASQQPNGQYCGSLSGMLDRSCQSIISRLPAAGRVGCLVADGYFGSTDSVAPVCLDETPEPVVDEAVIEAAVEVPDEDEGPDIVEILEQIPGLVAEEFATLPIDGGSVEFEEELLGFGYINRHTNVFAEVDQQSFEQNMLGIDVEIRAVPVDYHFDYGDGTTRTTADPGQSATGGDAVITDLETPTSHVYQDTGLYDVAVTTTFTGEYRISGGAWTPIADSASISASPGEADIWRIQSRHVSGECEAISQWGCNGPFTLEGDDRPPTIFADQYDDAGNWRGP